MRDVLIGLDLATSAGWAAASVTTGKILESGNWYCKAHKDGFPGDRQLSYRNSLRELLDRYDGRVLMVGFERPPVYMSRIDKKTGKTVPGTQYATLCVLFSQRGEVLAECARRALPVEEVPPASIKKRATGKGNASKQQVHDCIVKETGPIIATGAGCFDQADGRGVCLVLLDRVGNTQAGQRF